MSLWHGGLPLQSVPVTRQFAAADNLPSIVRIDLADPQVISIAGFPSTSLAVT